ncbi:hypothetical protein SAMN05421754_10809 [Nitrosomonas sp. Nm58]|nr:hypothetical protein SAMN05421754_10809 [Nitrosomonas sp. Nm58]
MITATTLLVLATLLCLAFNSTRLLGVICAAILFLLYPMLVTVMRFLAGITVHVISHLP